MLDLLARLRYDMSNGGYIMNDKMKIVLVTVALALLWVFLKVVLGLEFLAGMMESMGFVLGLRWTAIEIVKNWPSPAPVSDVDVEVKNKDL